MMKRTLAGILAAVAVFSAGATGVTAMDTGTGRYFVDANNDGICDNRGSHCRYTDTDNDGVCDNYTAGSCHRNGAGHRNGCQRGQNK